MVSQYFIPCILTVVCTSSACWTFCCTPWSTWLKRKEVLCKNYNNYRKLDRMKNEMCLQDIKLHLNVFMGHKNVSD